MAAGTWRTLWMGEPHFRSLGIKDFMKISPPEGKSSFFHFVNKFPLPDPQDGRIKVLLL
jgi:hypothetical protein